ncbi:MAG: hypothetical protein H0V35_02010, partial [Nitrospira sp.]|nr:hypothetical protein [Nitrospira sp.]
MNLVSIQAALRDTEAVVIGASAGAVASLTQILPPLPPDYPLAILIAVHVPSGKNSRIAMLFQSQCCLTVKEAEESAADAYGRALLAIILAGANQDGAHGIRAVC